MTCTAVTLTDVWTTGLSMHYEVRPAVITKLLTQELTWIGANWPYGPGGHQTATKPVIYAGFRLEMIACTLAIGQGREKIRASWKTALYLLPRILPSSSYL